MGLSLAERNNLGIPRKHSHPRESSGMSPAAKVFLDHSYTKKIPGSWSNKEDMSDEEEEEKEEKPDLSHKLL